MTTQSPSPPSATPPITQMRTTTPAPRHHTKPAQQHSTTSATSSNTPLSINADIIWTISPAALAAANPALYAKLIEILNHKPSSNNIQPFTPALRWQIRAQSTTTTKPTATAQPQLILIHTHRPATASTIPKASAAIDLAEPQPLNIQHRTTNSNLTTLATTRPNSTLIATIHPAIKDINNAARPQTLLYASTSILQSILDLPGGTYEQPTLHTIKTQIL